LLPQKIFNHRKHQIFLAIIYFIFINIIIFSIFSEIVFFEEFNARFNFIAIDYLIYTTEVIANIAESYPMGFLLMIILGISWLIFYFSYRKIVQIKIVNFKNRLKFFAIILAILLIEFFVIDVTKIDKFFDNNYNKELSQNGIYQLFSAYRNNQIDYDKFYVVNDSTVAENRLRDLISKQEPSAKFVDNRGIERFISAQKNQKEQKYNIIFITMESLSADFMAHFGNQKNLTSNLDEISKKGLFFTNLKATGTRTVRGLEALTLAIPPTPGNSIVRRPNNENLFNIATPLKQRGYDAKFIYGGDGYFDNMNYFFANNGFETIDRPQFSKNEITFSNAWGVADEDLFDKTIAEADKSHAKGKNFLNFVMTTSNHRPFTYPDNKIDIPSKTNRDGAVKYSDYAIGQLIKKSQNKSWFNNTIFVFVADHCAGSAGNSDIPLWRYQIPAIFYAPKIIKPQITNQGSGKGRTTTIHNYIIFIYSLHTKSTMTDLKERTSHLTAYVLYELFCKGHVANDKLILYGRFSINSIEHILKNYINLYVKCKCNSNNTTITKCTVRRVHTNKCELCGSVWSLPPITPKAKPKAEAKAKEVAEEEEGEGEGEETK
jgi:phosphoglycerol transferase MdoB-like AlkP superfamily enzyme